MRFEPVAAPSAVGDEGYAQLCCPLHLVDDDVLDALSLFEWHGEVEFVVYLQYHSCA